MKNARYGKGNFSDAIAMVLVLLFLVTNIGASGAIVDLPSEKELGGLILESMMKFNEALQAKDFAAFHSYISELWQKQATASELKDVFQPFIDAEIDISPARNLEAVLDVEPWIDDNGWLEVVGHYPTKPAQTAFNLSYVKEKGSWKLVGINVKVYPAEYLVPFDAVLEKMTIETMKDFQNAVSTKDFSNFHKSISILWRQQITPEELKEIFKSFLDSNIDLADVAHIVPQIDSGASIREMDGLNLLGFTGRFKLKSGILEFELKYLMEDGIWKLAGINVNI